MSWQAVELVRDSSRSTGATRLVGMVLASYANDHDGSGPYGGIFPSIDAIRRGTGARKDAEGKLKGGATRRTAIDARRWFVANGEAEIVGSKPSRTGSTIPVLSFTPLLARAKEESETDEVDSRAPARATSDSDSDSDFPFTSVSGALGAPFDDPRSTLQGCPESTLRVPPEHPSNGKGAPGAPLGGKGALSEPSSGSGLSVSSAGAGIQTEAQQAAERREDEEELKKLEAQVGGSGFSEATKRAIADLRSRLDRDEVAA